jgi:hypothetical protein
VSTKTQTKSSFWANRPVQPLLPVFLTAEEKEGFANEGVAFEVVNVREGNGEYGPCWWIICAVHSDDISEFDENDEIDEDGYVLRTITFGGREKNAIRDDMMHDLVDYLGPERPVTRGNGVPCRLVSFKTRSGNFAFSLAPIEDADETPEPESPARPARGSVTMGTGPRAGRRP